MYQSLIPDVPPIESLGESSEASTDDSATAKAAKIIEQGMEIEAKAAASRQRVEQIIGHFLQGPACAECPLNLFGPKSEV